MLVRQLAADLVSRITPRWEILQQGGTNRSQTASETNPLPSLDGFIEIPSSLLDFTWLGFLKLFFTLCDQSEGDSGRTDNLGELSCIYIL